MSSGRLAHGLALGADVILVAFLVRLSFDDPLPQDASVYTAASRLVAQGVTEVYPREGAFHGPPEWIAAFCEARGSPARCEPAPFVATPPWIALSAGVSGWSPAAIGLALRIVAALCTMLAVHVAIWRAAHRGPAVALGYWLTLPLWIQSVALGQTTGWLAVAAAFGGVTGGAAVEGVAGAALGVGILAKVSPGVVALSWFAERRWWALGACGLLMGSWSLGALAVVPVASWGDWLGTLGEFSRVNSDYYANVSVDRAGVLVGVGYSRGWALARLVAAGVALAWLRPAGPWRWPLLWALWLVIIPVSWPHYALPVLAAGWASSGSAPDSPWSDRVVVLWSLGSALVWWPVLVEVDGAALVAAPWVLGSLGLAFWLASRRGGRS